MTAKANTKAQNVFSRIQALSLKSLSRQHAPYLVIWILYYAWVVAFATWWTASPYSDSAFNTELRSLMHTVNLCASAAFVFIIKKDWFVRAARLSATLIVLSMVIFFIAPLPSVRFIAAIAGSVAIGCVNICILIPFVFTLNSTEKFYAVVLSNVLIQLLSLAQEYCVGAEYRLLQLVFPLALLVLALSATLFFRQERTAPPAPRQTSGPPVMNNRIYITLLLNCAVAILCKGAGKGILNITALGLAAPVLTWYYLGGLLGCLLYVAVYLCTSKAFSWLCNITFASVMMGLLCNALSVQAPGLALVFAVLLGVGCTVGMINMYYIIGVVGRKYDSMRYVQLSIFLIGLCGGVVGLLTGNFISSSGVFGISVVASVASAAALILFILATPLMLQTGLAEDWDPDALPPLPEEERPDWLQAYGLSKRELEVCRLLLQGYTLRQAAAILSLAYPTVNTYCTGAYRKLGINSRAELLLGFKDANDAAEAGQSVSH